MNSILIRTYIISGPTLLKRNSRFNIAIFSPNANYLPRDLTIDFIEAENKTISHIFKKSKDVESFDGRGRGIQFVVRKTIMHF